jgi:hypothetical protein
MRLCCALACCVVLRGALLRLAACRDLLLSPTWLENKTHWHGQAAVAKDFQAAMLADERLVPLCSLLMQAYTISAPATVAMPQSGTLLAQMLLRTSAICHLAGDALDPTFSEWWHSRVRRNRLHACRWACACGCSVP